MPLGRGSRAIRHRARAGNPGTLRPAIYDAVLAAPCCALGIRTGVEALEGICFLPATHAAMTPRNAMAERVCLQIERYLRDPGYRIEVPLAPRGTAFQRRVWSRIASIPPGRTRSYGEIAAEIGSAPRAVGQACGANAWPLVIPCHRVVARGGLGGFAHRESGYLLGVKRWLLDHEGANT